MPFDEDMSQQALDNAENELVALQGKTNAKRQTLPPQDQPPWDETVLTNGNIFRVYQRLKNGIFAIFGQLYGNDGVTPLGSSIPISNSTSHQIWPRVTPNPDGGANVFFVAYGAGADEVYRQPCSSTGNPISSAQQIPLLDNHLWTVGSASNPTSYSADFDSDTNKTYVWVRGQRRVSINTPEVIWSVYFDEQEMPFSNQHINAGSGENFPTASRAALAHSYDNSKNDLIFYPAAPKANPLLTITSARGNAFNRLNIGMLNNGSRVFVWQQNGGKVFFRRLTAGPTYTWLDAANGVLTYTLPGTYGEPQPNVIVKGNDNNSNEYCIIGRELFSGNNGTNTVGIGVREYQSDINGTLINPTPTPTLAINDTQAQFPRGIMLPNGKLCVTACQMVGGDCVALLINPDALNPMSTLSVTSTTTPNAVTNTTPTANASLTSAITTFLDLTATTSSSNSLNTVSNTPANSMSTLTSSDTTTTASMMMALTPSDISSTSINNNISSPFTSTILPGENSSSNNNMGAIIGGVVGGTVALLAVAGLAIWKWARGKNKNENKIVKEAGSVELGGVSSKRTSQYASAGLPLQRNSEVHHSLPDSERNSMQAAPNNGGQPRYTRAPARQSQISQYEAASSPLADNEDPAQINYSVLN
jgi:hypothetical protein